MPKQNWAEAPVPQADEELVAPLLESLSWARIYAGTRAALVAAGLVVDGQFPGDPGRAKRTQHYHGPPCWRIERRGRDWFSVRLPRSMPTAEVPAVVESTRDVVPRDGASRDLAERF